jgi:hypothetical protein
MGHGNPAPDGSCFVVLIALAVLEWADSNEETASPS